jgi:hypothetical protein
MPSNTCTEERELRAEDATGDQGGAPEPKGGAAVAGAPGTRDPPICEEAILDLLSRRDACRKRGDVGEAEALAAELFSVHRVKIDDSDRTWSVASHRQPEAPSSTPFGTFMPLDPTVTAEGVNDSRELPTAMTTDDEQLQSGAATSVEGEEKGSTAVEAEGRGSTSEWRAGYEAGRTDAVRELEDEHVRDVAAVVELTRRKTEQEYKAALEAQHQRQRAALRQYIEARRSAAGSRAAKPWKLVVSRASRPPKLHTSTHRPSRVWTHVPAFGLTRPRSPPPRHLSSPQVPACWTTCSPPLRRSPP